MWQQVRIWHVFTSLKKDLKNYFDTIDLKQVLPRLLSYLHETYQVKNVIWIEKAEFDRLRNCARSGAPIAPTQNLNHELVRQSTRPLADMTLLEHLNCFSAVGSNPELVDNHGESVALIPVYYPQSKTTQAYILMCGIPVQRATRIVAEVTSDLAKMTKHIEFSHQHWLAQKNAYKDDLSGLYNQSFLQMVLEDEIRRSQEKENGQFTVLFMDLDFFKSINEKHGHWIGSRILAEVGGILEKHIRLCDYGFRYGGDEFMIVLPLTGSEQAVLLAEELRDRVEKTEFIIDGIRLNLTMSVGLATFPTHAKTYKDLIKMADEGMYSAKIKSRNIVFVAS